MTIVGNPHRLDGRLSCKHVPALSGGSVPDARAPVLVSADHHLPVEIHRETGRSPPGAFQGAPCHPMGQGKETNEAVGPGGDDDVPVAGEARAVMRPWWTGNDHRSQAEQKAFLRQAGTTAASGT